MLCIWKSETRNQKLETRKRNGDGSHIWEWKDLLHRDAGHGHCAVGGLLQEGLWLAEPQAWRWQHCVGGLGGGSERDVGARTPTRRKTRDPLLHHGGQRGRDD